jgi:ribosomal protein S6
MKRYEGLFILNLAGREEGVKDALDKISAEIESAGGKVETVQKWIKRILRGWRTKSTSPAFTRM